MLRPHTLLPRLFRSFQAILRQEVAAPGPACKSPRARLRVERLEDKVVPSATLTSAVVYPGMYTPAPATSAQPTAHHATTGVAQFNGTYKTTYVAMVTTPFGSQNEHGAIPIHIANGVITASGHKVGTISSKGVLNVNANIQGATIHLHGQFKMVHSKPVGHGTLSGSFMGQVVTGTWDAVKTGK